MFPWILEEINHSSNGSDPDLRAQVKKPGPYIHRQYIKKYEYVQEGETGNSVHMLSWSSLTYTLS